MTQPLRILLIEDNQGDVGLLKEYIEMTGIKAELVTIEDGQEAMDFFKRNKERPDLVLLDLNLPQRTGHEVLEVIRKGDPEAKVVIYSGSKAPRDLERAKENKANAYLIKPMNEKEMKSFVNDLREILRAAQEES